MCPLLLSAVDLWCRPMQALFILPKSMLVSMFVDSVDLEVLVSLVSSIHAGSYTLSTSSFFFKFTEL